MSHHLTFTVSIGHVKQVMWLTLNAVLFWHTYTHYKYEPRFYYLHQMLGAGLCVSRGTASVINLNMGALLLPMCRSIVALCRGFSSTMPGRTVRGLIDRCKGFHIMCSTLVVLASCVHFFAHVFNAAHFSENYNGVFKEVNAANSPKEDPLYIVLRSVPGVTGLLMMVVLCLITTSAMTYVRYATYDIFYYVHRLYIVFYVLCLFHGIRGILKAQENVTSHTPGCMNLNMSVAFPEPEVEAEPEDEPLPCHSDPTFNTIGCSSWMWILPGLLLYICDAVYRHLHRHHHVAKVVNIIPHSAEYTELHLVKKGFTARPGQYVFIQCPEISAFEFHPYTISRVNCEAVEATAQIRAEVVLHEAVHAGNTTSMYPNIETYMHWSPVNHHPPLCIHVNPGRLKECLYNETEDQGDHELLLPLPKQLKRLYVEGPFGSAMEDVLRYRVSLCVAGGIGITPFSAILNHILDTGYLGKLERLYLVWVCKTISHFLPFARLLTQIHQHFWEYNLPDVIHIQLHTTVSESIDPRDTQSEMAAFPILQRRLHKGRPCWPQLLSDIASSYYRLNVGVFVCGPKSLSAAVEAASLQVRKNGVTFRCNHESF